MTHPQRLAALLALASAGCTWAPKLTYRLPASIMQPVGAPVTRDLRLQFSEVFCATLAHVGGTWQSCGTYVEGAASPATTLPDVPAVKVLVVAGVLSECLGDVKLFSDARSHLLSAHRVESAEVPVSGFGSSTANAKQVADYVSAHPGPWVAVGYSKGASDVMEALALYPDIRDDIVALVTVAGSVAGSRLPDLIPSDTMEALKRIVQKIGLGTCNASDQGAIDSLTRKRRQEFLHKYPNPFVPSYSIVGVTSEDETSKVLQPLWRRVEPFSLDQDSQVISEEGIVPGGALLGVALGDHWAVALPFTDLPEPKRTKALRQVTKNIYPRTALLEAALRLVGRELPSH